MAFFIGLDTYKALISPKALLFYLMVLIYLIHLKKFDYCKNQLKKKNFNSLSEFRELKYIYFLHTISRGLFLEDLVFNTKI